jgi:GNAT superfamily N-acetyltransferase
MRWSFCAFCVPGVFAAFCGPGSIPRPAAIVVFAATEVASDAQRLGVSIDDDHGVDAILVAAPAVVLNGLARSVLARRAHRATLATRMTYRIRTAALADIPHIVEHRAQMFREMGIPAQFEDMAAATESWLRHAIPSKIYLGWIAETAQGDVAAGGGLIVIPWPPGPMSMDPRCGFIFNVYTQPAHRKQGLARRMMDAMHEYCRAEGIERVVLNASTFGKPLYEDMGYVVANEPMMRMRL